MLPHTTLVRFPVSHEAGEAGRGSRKVGRGIVAWGFTAREWLLEKGVQPYCLFLPESSDIKTGAGEILPGGPDGFGYIHHRLGNTDYYFIRSGNKESTRALVTFRIVGRLPEFWNRSEEHTSELQSLMRISYAVFCLKKKNNV